MQNDRCDKKPYFTCINKNYVLASCHDNIIITNIIKCITL